MKRKNSREDYVPVQAYIPKNVYTRFKILYPKHGAASQLIRKAFLLAIEETDETADHAIRTGRALDPISPPQHTDEDRAEHEPEFSGL